MSIGARIVRAVPLQQIDNTPHAQASAQRNNESLQSRDMAIIVSDMARQEDVTEALKAADQMEWVRRMNSIRSRAEETVLTELVYE